jgi:hypothetical protein
MKKSYKNYNRILAGELYNFSSNYSIDVQEEPEHIIEQGAQFAENEEILDDIGV